MPVLINHMQIQSTNRYIIYIDHIYIYIYILTTSPFAAPPLQPKVFDNPRQPDPAVVVRHETAARVLN